MYITNVHKINMPNDIIYVWKMKEKLVKIIKLVNQQPSRKRIWPKFYKNCLYRFMLKKLEILVEN